MSKLALITTAVMLFSGATSLLAQQPPNIVVILCDDLGYADYSAFGTTDIQTPNIDRIFHEGATLTNFHANSSICSPSRAALLTGCYPDRVGIPGDLRESVNSFGYFSPSAMTLPSQLKQYGYRTALVGKWHLGLQPKNLPNARGFDYFAGFLADMMDDDYSHLRYGVNYMRINGTTVYPKGHITDILTNWAVAYLQDNANNPAPFFLELAYTTPHIPIQPTTAWLNQVKAEEPGVAEQRQEYVALVEQMDAGIGQVLQTLDDLNLASNTLVIFTSDNGGLLSSGANDGPTRGEKGTMYEGGLRVPAAARWTGTIPAASTIPRLILTMDVFSTICDAAGATPPPGIDGVSFLPDLVGGTPLPSNPNAYFVLRYDFPKSSNTGVMNALISGNWKLIQEFPSSRTGDPDVATPSKSPCPPFTLYDLGNDPLESTDLSAQNPAVLSKLVNSLGAHVQLGIYVPWIPPPPMVTGLNPTSGDVGGGTIVKVTGSGFTGATSVDFGGAGATILKVVSDTLIKATSPAGSGTVDITVGTVAGTSAPSVAGRFTYTAAAVVPGEDGENANAPAHK